MNYSQSCSGASCTSDCIDRGLKQHMVVYNGYTKFSSGYVCSVCVFIAETVSVGRIHGSKNFCTDV